MKAVGIGAVIVLVLGAALAIKAYQFASCRGDGLSVGTCIAIVSR